MPKINVYLPDDLADSVRDLGVPVSPICQRALEGAVRRITAVRQAVLDDVSEGDLTTRLPSFTARAVATLAFAIDRAKGAHAPAVTTGDMLHGILAEGSNLGLRILTAMEVAPASLTAPDDTEPALPDVTEGLHFSAPAAMALEFATGEALGLGHNYVGCEHLLIGLAAEPDGTAGELLRSRNVDAKAARRSVSAALAGYAALQANLATNQTTNFLQTALRAELAPLIQRIEALEARP